MNTKKLALSITLLLFSSFLFLGCTKTNANSNVKKENTTIKATATKAEKKADSKITAKVRMETNKGVMILGLYGKLAPVTVKNFLSYVEDGFYNGVVFHRVIPGFVIQGGGFAPGMNKKPTKAPIKLEIAEGLKHKKGILSMARTMVRDSGTSQFFVCLNDVPSLDNKYAVFGELLKGEKVLDSIAAVETTQVGPYRDVPKEDVIIKKASIIK